MLGMKLGTTSYQQTSFEAYELRIFNYDVNCLVRTVISSVLQVRWLIYSFIADLPVIIFCLYDHASYATALS